MDEPQVYCPDRESWRSWLEEHHESGEPIWLIFYKKETGKATLSYEEAVEEAVCFGWVEVLVKKIDSERYAQKFTPRKVKSEWSTSSKKRVERMIEQGLMTEAGMRTVRTAKENGMWEKVPLVERANEVPDDFRALLEETPPAFEYFESLAPGYKRQYIAWIISAKRDETRQRRLAKAIEKLSMGQKLEES